MKVLVTGASGVLGTAVLAAFKSHGHEAIGLAHSRASGELKALDLLDRSATEQFIAEIKPDWVIHCAAERRPDVAEKNPEGTEQLNVGVPGFFAELSAKYSFVLVYISTDYVFDGANPPYSPSSPTNPLQLYGRTKLGGELAVLAVPGAQNIILRVPVLYGPAPNNADSAVNILLDVVQDQSGKTYKMDHFATRYPTNVVDIAEFLVRLSAHKKPLPPIIHYSAGEPFTKYEMCLIFSKILGLPHEHIIPDAEPPKGDAATTRPRDSQLSTEETVLLGIDGGLGYNGFEEWWTAHLKK
ncbi:NAD(P)-binding protein [Exidia glandulosa HHB12029]|uniref:NAD(P)-binding protein n=1 Tax=Exidia glandulosa HHB12029 TaxID=1314781 RepID=A0A165QG76_EXIGL|nr:NAD(P)-binding protein [Exidia glandulosa HHB12029]